MQDNSYNNLSNQLTNIAGVTVGSKEIIKIAHMLRAHRHACAQIFMIFPRTHENWVQHPMGMRARNLAFPRMRTLV